MHATKRVRDRGMVAVELLLLLLLVAAVGAAAKRGCC
jgi:hypothetical protein